MDKDDMEISEYAGVKKMIDDSENGWDTLVANGREKKEAILVEHFPKALERFRAGVSLAQIRANYERLGAKYSPITFRKKWDALLKKHPEPI